MVVCERLTGSTVNVPRELVKQDNGCQGSNRIAFHLVRDLGGGQESRFKGVLDVTIDSSVSHEPKLETCLTGHLTSREPKFQNVHHHNPGVQCAGSVPGLAHAL